MERRVRECSSRQIDFAAQVQDLRDFGGGLQVVEAQFLQRQFEPPVDLPCRDEFFARWRHQVRLQHR
jgi:hypothetical protein